MIFTNLVKKYSKKNENLLKSVQFSPIWTKLCQNFPTIIIKILTKPQGPKYPNKVLNEGFFSLKKYRKKSLRASTRLTLIVS